MKRFTKELQLEIVKKLVSGELLPEEAMIKYNIKSRRSISRWVKEHHPIARRLLDEEKVPVDVHKEKKQMSEKEQTGTIHFLYEIIGLHEKVYQMEKNSELNKQWQQEMRNELESLKIELQQLKER